VGLIVKNAWPMQIEISNAIARLLRNCSAHLTIMLDDSPNSGLYLKIVHNLKTCWTISLRAILRITGTGKVRVITVYEDKAKGE
jgi:hypothetical protein